MLLNHTHTRLLLGAALVLLGGLLSGKLPTTPTHAQTLDWRYHPAPCEFTIPAGYTAACGWLNVPQDRSAPPNPTLARLDLHVATFHSTNPNPPADPIVYLVGGPGVSLLYDIETTFYHFEPYIHNRDVIVFEQRGTGFSRPALRCEPGYYAEDSLENARRCATVFRQRGFDLDNFNSVESAGDADDLRQALGFAEWNVVGVSYGSRLAQVIARDYPGTVRSVLLDSVVGLGPFQDIVSGYSTEYWLQQIITDCANDASCNTTYPQLQNTFDAVLERLNRNPPTLQRPDGTTLRLLPATFTELLRQIASNTAGAWRVPAIITAANNNDFSALANHDAGYTFWNLMNRAVNCNDAPTAAMFAIDEFCRAVGAPSGPGLNEPPATFAVPTLVLNGRYDSITPTAIAAQVAEQLPRATLYEFPYLAHGVVRSAEPCARALAFAFLDDPATKPTLTARCIEATRPQFVTQDAGAVWG